MAAEIITGRGLADSRNPRSIESFPENATPGISEIRPPSFGRQASPRVTPKLSTAAYSSNIVVAAPGRPPMEFLADSKGQPLVDHKGKLVVANTRENIEAVAANSDLLKWMLTGGTALGLLAYGSRHLLDTPMSRRSFLSLSRMAGLGFLALGPEVMAAPSRRTVAKTSRVSTKSFAAAAQATSFADLLPIGPDVTDDLGGLQSNNSYGSGIITNLTGKDCLTLSGFFMSAANGELLCDSPLLTLSARLFSTANFWSNGSSVGIYSIGAPRHVLIEEVNANTHIPSQELYTGADTGGTTNPNPNIFKYCLTFKFPSNLTSTLSSFGDGALILTTNWASGVCKFHVSKRANDALAQNLAVPVKKISTGHFYSDGQPYNSGAPYVPTYSWGMAVGSSALQIPDTVLALNTGVNRNELSYRSSVACRHMLQTSTDLINWTDTGCRDGTGESQIMTHVSPSAFQVYRLAQSKLVD